MKLFSGVFATYRVSVSATGKKRIKQSRLTACRNQPKTLSLRAWVFWLALLSGMGIGPVAQAAPGNIRALYDFDIPVQSVRMALSAVARQTQFQLVFSSELVKPLQSHAVKGRMTIDQALAILLQDTSLSGRVTERGVIVVQAISALNNNGREKVEMNTKKNILASTIAFFVGAGGASQGYAAENTEAEVSWLLEEVVVTATKRETSLQDTAMSISAIGGETIDKRNLVGMEDYLPFIPGVSMQDRGTGQNDVVVRGIGSGDQREPNPATGVYFGETPVTGLSNPTNFQGAGSGDIKLVDIERVEVLKGPQGTLYGAGSMGGTVRIIPNKPNLSELGGKVAASFSQTGEEGGDNTMVQGVINLPLIEDQLAVRAVVYQFDNDGYIDNIAASYQTESALIAQRISEGGVAVDRKAGGQESTGYRLSALWQPIEQFSATLSYINQEVDQEGLTSINLNLPGDYQEISMAIDSNGRGEFQSNETDIINLVLEYDLGWGTLFSSTSNIEFEANSGFDGSLFSFASEPSSTLSVRDTDIFVQELRFVSALDGPIQVLLGYYYEDKEAHTVNAVDSRGLIFIPGAFRITFDGVEVVEQQSLFGELSYDLTEQFTATLGFRSFDYDQSLPFSQLDGVVRPSQGQAGNISDTNYKFNLSYKPNDDTLIYAQWAEGFRIGRFQGVISPENDPDGNGLVNFPDGERKVQEGILDPDTTETLELGVKASFMDHRVTLNAAIFHTDWEGIPLLLVTSFGNGLSFNVGKSEVDGVEIEVVAQLSEDWVLNIGSSYIESVLAEDNPSLGGVKGENMPGSADFNFNVGLEHQFTLGEYDSFIRADYAYVDEYEHAFKSKLVEIVGDPVAGGYSLLNLKAGMEVNDINLDLFVKNLTNANDFTWFENGLNSSGEARAYRLKPRTIGFNVSYDF
jgi:outer membrane receptor protein involved in Fe transport